MTNSTDTDGNGVPFDGREALRHGWKLESNPYPAGEIEGIKWLADWWAENYECFYAHIYGELPIPRPVSVREAAQVLWQFENSKEVQAACENRVKFYKFQAVLVHLMAEEENQDG